MAYNFPDSPTPGQEYTPPVGGQTYIWSPPRWIVKGIPPAGGGGGSSGIDEAPTDAKPYVRKSAAWDDFTDDMALKAPLASPALTGTPTAPTPTAGDSSTSLATTGFVANAVAAIGVGGMSTAEYNFIATTTPPPSTGQLRGNNATQSAITAFYLSDTNAVGVDITNALKLVAAGVKVLVQDKTNSANVQYYVTSGPTVDNGTYFTVPVTWNATGSGTPFTAGRVIFAAFGVGSNNMPEAPSDGQVYGRRGSDTSWQSVTGATAQTRNRIVNGALQVSQEQGNTLINGGGWPADQWYLNATNVPTISTQRVQVTTPKGSRDRIRLTMVTAQGATGATTVLHFMQFIEGIRVADFLYGTASAKQAVLRFGWKSPAGTYSVAILNGGDNRSYIANFTVSAGQANTDTEQTLIIPGDVTGTWLRDTGIGLQLRISVATGSNTIGVLGWQAGWLHGTSANTNGMATAGAVYELFDVGLYLDPNATGVPPPWQMPDEAAELAACLRYYEGLTISVAHSGVYGTHYFKAVKRIQPALSFSQAGFVDINADAKAFYASGSSTISIYWSANARM